MLEIGVDWVALSFVQRPEDIVEIKRLIMEYNPSNAFPPHVMAKIEKPSCFVGNSLEEIVRLSDGISEFTVARPTTRAVFCFVVPPPFAMSRSFSNNTTRPCGASSSSSFLPFDNDSTSTDAQWSREAIWASNAPRRTCRSSRRISSTAAGIRASRWWWRRRCLRA